MSGLSVTALYRLRVATGKVKYDRAQEAAAARLSDLAERIKGWSPRLGSRKSGPGVRGIYLHGAVGRGKSMLMEMFFEAADAKNRRTVHFLSFMQEIYARIQAERTEGKRDPVAKIAKAIAADDWLLCFDEFQVKDITHAMMLEGLFEHLFKRGVVLVATSNVHPDDLYKDGINRQSVLPFIDMLKAHVELIELDADHDYRTDKADTDPIWFQPLGREADARMDEAWRRALGDAPERSESLDVMGRRLEVPRATKGAARFTFDQLFVAALGPPDYLALAGRYATIFVDRIPKLGPGRTNEANRFVTLIDALYQAKSRLVASADVAPGEVYAAGADAFEFQRAASRLIEMRRKEYAAGGDRTDSTNEKRSC